MPVKEPQNGTAVLMYLVSHFAAIFCGSDKICYGSRFFVPRTDNLQCLDLRLGGIHFYWVFVVFLTKDILLRLTCLQS